jgi:phage terminase large subunit-like protein
VTDLLDRSVDQVRADLEHAEQDALDEIVPELEAILYRWRCDRVDCDGEPHGPLDVPHARGAQVAPLGDWLVWLILAGRGWGKTRTGAEWVKEHGMARPERIALVAATLDDVRDTMVEGESGLLSILPPSALRGGSRDKAWNRSMAELYLANGTKFKGYTAEKPNKLRGPQHHRAWCDEPMSWKDAHLGPEAEDTTWSNLMLGLRLGDSPQVVVTGTPKRRRLLVGRKGKPGIIDEPSTVVTKGSTYHNLKNLAKTFKAKILAKYEGTRVGRQELNAEILEDVEGALWTAEDIEADRVADRPLSLQRVAVAIDPAVTSGEDSDETGIIIGGRTDPGLCPHCGPLEAGIRHAFVFADRSGRYTPAGWATVAIGAHDLYESDRVLGEVNNGGDLVESNLRAVDPSIPYESVHASRGKRTRAEPVSALYEQHRVHHVGALDELEDQQTSWVPDSGADSPDRVDALVWLLTDLLLTDEKNPGSIRW